MLSALAIFQPVNLYGSTDPCIFGLTPAQNVACDTHNCLQCQNSLDTMPNYGSADQCIFGLIPAQNMACDIHNCLHCQNALPTMLNYAQIHCLGSMNMKKSWFGLFRDYIMAYQPLWVI